MPERELSLEEQNVLDTFRDELTADLETALNMVSATRYKKVTNEYMYSRMIILIESLRDIADSACELRDKYNDVLIVENIKDTPGGVRELGGEPVLKCLSCGTDLKPGEQCDYCEECEKKHDAAEMRDCDNCGVPFETDSKAEYVFCQDCINALRDLQARYPHAVKD